MEPPIVQTKIFKNVTDVTPVIDEKNRLEIVGYTVDVAHTMQGDIILTYYKEETK